MALPRQYTIRYKTYLKQSLVEALEAVFENHPDQLLQDTKVRLESSFEEVDYPMIIVKYHETTIKDAGIGHHERGYDTATSRWYKRQRKLYYGTVEFQIYALSTLDRDLISDALVQTIMMAEVRAYTAFFLYRIYRQETFEQLKSLPAGTLGTAHHYSLINLGTQQLTGIGDSAVPNPWGAEDVLLYQDGYSLPVFGEVISMPPDILYNLLSEIVVYPYVGGIDAVPTGAVDPALWVTE